MFLGTIIGGSLFNQFNQWIDSPSSAVTILGTAAPLTSIFFLTYILLQVFPSQMRFRVSICCKIFVTLKAN